MTETMSSGTRRPRLGAHYWRLWWANAISSTGDGAFVAALPLLAVTITRDPRLVAVVTAADYLPWMVLSLPAGALVDRYDRATLMWRAQAVQAAVVAAVAIGVVFRVASIAVLGLAGLLLGSAEVVFSNAAQAVLPCPGAARAPGPGQRQPAGQPDRGGDVPRAAGRQPAVRRGRGAAVRPGRRLVRRVGGAAGQVAPDRPGRPPGGGPAEDRHPRPDRRGAALAVPAPPAARGRRPARRLQLRQPDGPGRPGAAGHPDAARRDPRVRAAAGRDRRGQRDRRPGEPGGDPPGWACCPR